MSTVKPKTESLTDDPSPPADFAAWRQRVEKELGQTSFDDALVHRTGDGLEIQPLYTPASLPGGLDPAALPGAPPNTRGTTTQTGWRLVQEVSDPEPAAAAETMRADQRHGARWLWLRVTGHEEGIRATDAAGVEALVAAVRPGTAVVLDAGAEARALAKLWMAAAGRLGVDAGKLVGSFGCDPLAHLARRGELPGTLDAAFHELADLAAAARADTPGMRSVLVAATPHHDAGATAAQELAFAVATGVEYLRRMTAAGLDLDAAAQQLDFAFSIGRDLFGEIAKLRAARLLWSKVVAAAGGGETAQAMRLHARTSALETSRRDPWMNLLRGAGESLAAALGGADTILTAPYDEVLDRPGPAGRRLAANAQHILAAEAALGRVADPAGGSWYVEALTDALARAAWDLFRDLERRGGMTRCLTDGVVGDWVRASAEARRDAVAAGRELIVGANAFVEDGEPAPESPADARSRRRDAPEGSAARLDPFRLAEPYEEGAP